MSSIQTLVSTIMFPCESRAVSSPQAKESTMKTNVECPWSPLACGTDSVGNRRQIRGYVHYCRDRKVYIAMVCPETVEVVARTEDPDNPLAIRSCKSHECLAIVLESGVKRYSERKHANMAEALCETMARTHGAKYGYQA